MATKRKTARQIAAERVEKKVIIKIAKSILSRAAKDAKKLRYQIFQELGVIGRGAVRRLWFWRILKGKTTIASAGIGAKTKSAAIYNLSLVLAGISVDKCEELIILFIPVAPNPPRLQVPPNTVRDGG